MDKTLGLLQAVIITGVVLIACGEQAIPPIKCECQNVNNQYMNCSCCPPQVDTDYDYKIYYKYQHSGRSEPDHAGECRKEWASDPAIGCDCLFCGVIEDKTHPQYNICKYMDEAKKPFKISSGLELLLNVTVSKKGGQRKNAGVTVSPSDFILKPARVKIEELKSYLSPNNSVLIELKWKPHLEVQDDNLEYYITWSKQEDKTIKKTNMTKETHVMLEDLEPNTFYDIEVKCRPARGGYYSDTTSSSILTAEKCYEEAPLLVNYQADYSECHDLTTVPCVKITVFWQPISNMQSANCTGHVLEVRGSSGSTRLNASCDDVMAVLEKALLYGDVYNVSLYAVSKVGASPASHLVVSASKDQSEVGPDILDMKVVRWEQNSSVVVSIQWKGPGDPPDHYGVFYCKAKNSDHMCERDVHEKKVSRQEGDLTLNDTGSGYLYNVASYWGNRMNGLSSQWHCAFDYCGRLYKPQTTLTAVDEDSMTIKISEVRPDPLCSTHDGRGLPARYSVLVQGPGKNFTKTVYGSDPFQVPSLSPNTQYKVSVRSHGNCGQVESKYDTFKTSAPRALAASPRGDQETVVIVITVIIFLVLIMTVCAVALCCYIKKYKRKKESLETGTVLSRKALSSVSGSTNAYTKKWVESQQRRLGDGQQRHSDSDDYAEYEPIEPNSEVVDEPSSSDDPCPIIAKYQKKWRSAFPCWPVNKSPMAEEYKRVQGQMTPLDDLAPSLGINSADKEDSASLTKTTGLDLVSLNKEEQKPTNDSGCIQESSNEKRSPSREDPGVQKTDTPERLNSIQDGGSSPILRVPEPPDNTVPKPQPNIDNMSNNTLNQPLNVNSSNEKFGPVHIKQDYSGNGLPSYMQCASASPGGSDSQKLPQDNDYQKLPFPLASADEQTDSVTSNDDDDDDDDVSSDQSFSLDAVEKIPAARESPRNIFA